ncbi:hypothetical protein COT75_05395 [Candidatus Beckwithbacteria bacterium CG10_big_fil_rev_8_21_14_0_10_34_10]|uniref:Uncharacterized protein n=1 Tax=Candidatus Beckwithbacteria bacterium CG10_big_fil_rev_8_21_14_0_10_34_10 TaxID=1974495 RepID=A0A2H0W7P7_9BACT|nr:MAG: hypothetical protein COT75_05395 [Candidatus Beckwithbacteria bacterium CG10_big_fil_rev_8_21_14_0_10_34_10]
MPNSDLSKLAINKALEGNWQEARDLNLQSLKKNSKDIDALCRLAKAYICLANTELALKTYRKILRLDRFNQIAQKNLNKYINNERRVKNQKRTIKVDPGIFLEEPGKTKIVSLVGLASPKVIFEVETSMPVKLVPKKHSISVYDDSKKYLGKIPDDLSNRLFRLIKNGNQYKAVVKSVSEKQLTIFIKEVSKSKKNLDIPSFATSKDQYLSYIPPEALDREPIQEIENLEE